MKKLIIVLLMAIGAFSLAACAAKEAATDKPVFVTENISKISFSVQPIGEIEVSEEDVAEITQWLATFRLGEQAPDTLAPGSNSVQVSIEYSDGTSIENGLSTYQADGVHYYLTSDDAPACYVELLDAAAVAASEPEAEAAGQGEQTEFSLIRGDKALALGQQIGAFPWGAELTEAGRELWSSDGFDCFRIVTNEGLTLSGLRQEDAADETDGMILGLIATDPAFATYRGVSVGMSETELLEQYPEARRQDEPGTVQTWGAAGDVAYDCAYATPESADDPTRAIFFAIADGQIVAIELADGMDGPPAL